VALNGSLLRGAGVKGVNVSRGVMARAGKKLERRESFESGAKKDL